jgi:hypothetical protein
VTKHPDLFAALASPFEAHEVKVRSQSGRQLHYITARTAMNRLDDVLGPEHWWDEYEPSEKSVLCRLTIRLPDGTTLTKCDAGGYAGMADSGDDDKSGYSDSFKRAAVKFGIARYLYRDGVPHFVQERVSVPPPAEVNGHAEPARPRDEPRAPRRDQPPPEGNGRADGAPPRSGKALFAWTRDQEQQYEVGLLKYLTQWAKLQDFPARMVEWDAEQVQLAYQEACRKLQSLSGGGDAYEDALAN